MNKVTIEKDGWVHIRKESGDHIDLIGLGDIGVDVEIVDKRASPTPPKEN